MGRGRTKRKAQQWDSSSSESDSDIEASDGDLDDELLAITGAGKNDEKASSNKAKPVAQKKRKIELKSSEEEGEEPENGDQEEEEEQYDENGYGDEEDRKWLLSLNEIERESILMKRHEEREKREARRELERKARQRQKRSESNKSKAVKETLNAMASQRAKSKQRQATRKQDREEPDEVAPVPQEEIVEEAKEDEMTYKHAVKIQLTRDMLARWHMEKWFKEKILGFFVRIGIGYHPEANKRVYRFAQIVGVQEGNRKYTLNGKETWLTLRLKHADNEKDFRIELVSNQRLMSTEYDRWLRVMKMSKISIPNIDFVEEKIIQLEEMQNYRKTEEDIQEQIRKNKEKGLASVNLAEEKARLLSQLEVVPEHEKGAILKELEKIKNKEVKIEQINPNTNRLKEINKRHQQKNMTNVIGLVKGEEEEEDSVFHRRPTAPSVMVFTGHVDSMVPEIPAAPVAKPEPPKEKKEVKKVEKKDESELQDQLKNAFDIDLSIDISENGNDHKPAVSRDAKRIVTPSNNQPLPQVKKTLSLLDYQRRRGLLPEEQ